MPCNTVIILRVLFWSSLYTVSGNVQLYEMDVYILKLFSNRMSKMASHFYGVYDNN